MELALGTVQFGLRYGVAGRETAVPAIEVRAILSRAAQLGIGLLDTAAAYGEIESRLAALAGDNEFRVVTKLPPLPPSLGPTEATDWLERAFERAQSHLGESLHAVMLHHADDLLGPLANVLWTRCAAYAEERGIRLGVSCYEPDTLQRLHERFPIVIAQLPGNALDQRLRKHPVMSEGVDVHLRSAFLQGLLLMQERDAAQRVPAAAAALARWHRWLGERGLAPLPAALGIVKGLDGVSHCVVGVNDLRQLEEIAEAWQSAPVLRADALSTLDLDVIDPRRWPRRT